MRRWPSTASILKTSRQPNAKAYTQRVLFEQATQGVILGDEIALLRVLIRRFADQVQSSQGVPLTESAKHLAVVSEAMLRLCWSEAEPPLGGCLLRTDHTLGGAHSKSALRASSTLMKQLSLALDEITDEIALNEP